VLVSDDDAYCNTNKCIREVDFLEEEGAQGVVSSSLLK
jgi:hypothetical protein